MSTSTVPPVAQAQPPTDSRPKRRPLTAGAGESRANWPIRITLAIVVVGFVIPTLGLFVTSFRTRADATSTSWWGALARFWDTSWTLDSYREVLEAGMGNAFINSLVLTVPATIIPILIATMAAYAFTFLHFRGRDLLFVLLVGLLVVPNQVALAPLLRLFAQFDLVGEFVTVWLAHTGFGLPLAVFILRNYMSTLPRAVIESAKIDGASHYQTFWRLIVPMSVPALAAFAIFQFLWVWNDLLIATLFVGSGSNAPVTVQLSGLIGQYGQRWDLLSSGAFISMLVPVIVFFALQRYFVRGLTAGAVKG